MTVPTEQETKTPPAPSTPTGPDEATVKGWARDAVEEFFSGKFGPPPDDPKVTAPRTDKEMEELVAKIVGERMKDLNAHDGGVSSTDPVKDPPPSEPENVPEDKVTWTAKARSWLWE